jgi:hypothetical protein
MKIGEQEREALRVDAQRLREELSDLKIEADILRDKIKKQESRHLSDISTTITVPESPTSAASSPRSGASSPLITTPPDTKSVSTAETVSEVQDPPSPPEAEASSTTLPKKPVPIKTPASTAAKKSRLPSADHSVTPKPKPLSTSTAPRTGPSRTTTSNPALRTPAPRTSGVGAPPRSVRASSQKLPTSNSLSHIRSLTAQMQRLEARVHSARSKLPAPTATPPRASPLGSSIPSTVTVRSRKRAPGSAASSSVAGSIDDTTPTNPHHYPSTNNFSASTSSNAGGRHVPRLSTSGVSRLSFGPLPNRGPGGAGTDSDLSRPSSRASVSSFARPASRADNSTSSIAMPPPRPVSRASLSGARTPLGRPRSSLSGSVHGHGHSASVSYAPVTPSGGGMEDGDDREMRTPSRRGTYSKFDSEGGVERSGIPMPSSARRQSGVSGIPAPGGSASRRTSAIGTGKKLGDLGETY